MRSFYLSYNGQSMLPAMDIVNHNDSIIVKAQPSRLIYIARALG